MQKILRLDFRDELNMENMISILYITSHLHEGGSEKHISQVLPALKKRGFNIEVFLMGPKGVMAKPLEDAGIKIIDNQEQRPKKVDSLSQTLNYPLENAGIKIRGSQQWWVKKARSLFVSLQSLEKDLRTILRVRSYLRKKKPDICHNFLPRNCAIGGMAAILAGQKILVGSRRSLADGYRGREPWIYRFEKFAMARMSAVLGNCKAVVEELLEEGVSKERTGLIYNGIDSTQYQCKQTVQEIRQAENIREDAFVMVILANLIPYKGHLDLIKCLGGINKKLPHPWILVCVGRDWGIKQELIRESEILNTKPNIRFLGARENVGRLIKICDLAISCSHTEGFSNSVLECQLLGLPVIATRVGGNVEAVEHGKTGLLFEPGNIESLGQAILELAFDREKRKQMGEAARKRVESRFSYEKCINNYIKLYESLLASKNMDISELLPYSE